MLSLKAPVVTGLNCRTQRSARAVAARPRLVRTRFQGEQVDLYSNGTFDFKQSPRIKVGDRVPTDAQFLILDDGASEPRTVSVDELLKGKKAVLFGLPGAYTSICSSKHVPNFNDRYQELRDQGVDLIACLSVNDPWVMREWARNLNVDPSRILMLADGEGLFHSRIGLLQHMPGLGIRAIRYSMLVDDGKVLSLNVEEPGGKSYKISGPARMLEDLERLKNA